MEAQTTIKGPRATKLDEILDRSLKQTLRACSYEKLASCFPTLAQNDGETLRYAQEQLVDFLTTASRSEFDKILRERDAIERLNELDEMIREARERKEAGQAPSENPSDLSPDVVLRAHLLPIKRAGLAKVNASLRDVQAQNAVHLAQVEEQRSQIDARTRALKDALATLDAVVASASDTNSALKLPRHGGIVTTAT